jgi:glycosyltransferase involved in cell wall biosynthesis
MKKNLLFVLGNMEIGGTAKALISLLNLIDYNRYNVELLLFNKEGIFLDEVNKNVKILSINNNRNKNGFISKLKITINSLINYIRFGVLIDRVVYNYVPKERQIHISQKLAIAQARAFKKLQNNYDVAIAYMELWSTSYVSLKVSAKKKIAWVHVDYQGAGFSPNIDRDIYRNFDNIVTVSEKCLVAFNKSFPEYKVKSLFIENAINYSQIKSLSLSAPVLIDSEFSGLKLITVCRLANIHKGLDRAVKACGKLVEKGINVKWYVIGDGPDKEIIQSLITENKLENSFILLGSMKNPYPYIKAADLFVLPSRYEGKPLVITEAFIIGCPVIVTNYASAKLQVSDKYGYVTENDDEVFIKELLNLCLNPNEINIRKENLKSFSFNNSKVVDKVNNLIN